MKFLAVLAALVVPPAVYFPTIGARGNAAIRAAENELVDLDKRVEQARAAQRKLEQFHAEVARLDEELQKLRTILPPAIGIDEVRALTASRAVAHGVQLTRFGGSPTSVTAEAVGSAESLAEFFRDLQNARHIIDVTHVTLRKEAEAWRAGFVMTTYALAD